MCLRFVLLTDFTFRVNTSDVEVADRAIALCGSLTGLTEEQA